MNWYATNLEIFHKAANSNPPNYDLMEHIIMSTLLKLEGFTVYYEWKPQKLPSKSQTKYLLMFNQHTIEIHNEHIDSNKRNISVILKTDTGKASSLRGTADNMNSLLGDTVNMVIREIIPRKSYVLYQ